MGNEIYKQHDLFSYMYVCVDVVVHFTMNLVIMIHQEIYMPANCSIFSFVCIPAIGALFIHKSPCSCSFPQFWNSMTNI